MKLSAMLLATSVLFALPALAQETAAPKDYTMITVNGEDIKYSEVMEVWKSLFPNNVPPAFETMDDKVKANVLRGVASEHLLLKQAEKTGVQDSPEVKARIEAAKNQIVIREFLKQKTKSMVPDDKLKAAYDEHVKALSADSKEEVHARHILVKTEAEARDIEKKLRKGADFAALAKEKSEDKGSGASGGDLGWFTSDKMVPEFAKAAFALKKGEISPPVKTDFGWHVIQVEDRRKTPVPIFDEMKGALEQEVGGKAVNDYVIDMMKNAKITEYSPDGKASDLPSLPPEQGSASSPDVSK